MKNGIVIVTYNRLALLKKCLEHVFAQTLPFAWIIVVDNHSTDGTDRYLREVQEAGELTWGQTEVTVLSMEENLGGAGGFARGMAKAMGCGLDWVTAIDDDAMLDAHYMERLMEYAAGHRDAVALSGTVTAHGRIQAMHRRRVVSRLFFLERNVGLEEYEQEAFSCDCATFCGLTVRGNVLRQVGLPNAEYFLWYDDTEFSLRFQEYGGVVNVNRALLDHRVVEEGADAGLLERTTWRHYYGCRNRYDTARRHFGPVSAWMVAWEYRLLIGASCLMWLSPRRRRMAGFNIRMIYDALKSAQNRKFGKNEAYFFNDPKVEPVSDSHQRRLDQELTEQKAGQEHLELS